MSITALDENDLIVSNAVDSESGCYDYNLMNEFAYLEKDLFKANDNQYMATDSDTNCATSISNDSFTSDT